MACVRGRSGIKGLLLVASAAALVVGCGADSESEETAGCSSSLPSGAMPVLFQPNSDGATTDAEVEETIQLLCQRTNSAGIDDPVVGTNSEGLVEFYVPGEGGERRAMALAAKGELGIYDWEPNVIPARRSNDPAEDPIFRREDAEVLAAQNSGAIVVEERFTNDAPPTYFVIRDRPALTGAELRKPEVVMLPSFSGPGPEPGEPVELDEPGVAFEFTSEGQTLFQKVTRAIARRGAAEQQPRGPSELRSGHFAIVLDGKVMSRPIVDFVEFPDGIDGRAGASIAGDFTDEDARDLVGVLDTGPLPVTLTPAD